MARQSSSDGGARAPRSRPRSRPVGSAVSAAVAYAVRSEREEFKGWWVVATGRLQQHEQGRAEFVAEVAAILFTFGLPFPVSVVPVTPAEVDRPS